MLIHQWLDKEGWGAKGGGEHKEAEGGGGTKGKSVACERYFGKGA